MYSSFKGFVADMLEEIGVLEVSGSPGSGRRLFVWGIIDVANKRGLKTAIIDAACSKKYVIEGGVDVYEVDLANTRIEEIFYIPWSYDLIVVDSIPRLFYDPDLPYRKRWGYVASILYMLLSLARKGRKSVLLNYYGKRPFGERILANYFTHRAVIRKVGEEIIIHQIYPTFREVKYEPPA